MIKQITIILSCALLGFGLSCTNSNNTGGVGQTCRSILGRFDNMFVCNETTQCTEEDLQSGAKSGKCAAISTNCTKQTSTQMGGRTATSYICTGTPPEVIAACRRFRTVLPSVTSPDTFSCFEREQCEQMDLEADEAYGTCNEAFDNCTVEQNIVSTVFYSCTGRR